MNIKVITRHNPSNYGSLLQSIATLHVLEELGHNAQIIDYQRKDERGIKATIAQVNQKAGYSHNVIKKILYILIRYPMETITRLRFDSMRKRYLNLTQRFCQSEQLTSLAADTYMTGSDQVWGPLYNGKYDTAYFLSFVKYGRKLAYASSFGKAEFCQDVIKEYKQLLSTYDAIAVREDSAVKLLSEWNIACKGQVLDPTLMLNGRQWAKMIQKEKYGKYVLVYQIHNDTNLNKYAVRFAQNVGLPLIRVSPHLHQMNRGGKFVWCPDVLEFLAYIKGCTYLITDSFHGTCFAINFNRQFIELLPNTSTGSRNQSILRVTGLENRILKTLDDFSIADDIINYDKVNDILEKERVASMHILENMLNI